LQQAVNDNQPVAADILRGAGDIATWLGVKPRAVYHLAATGQVPTFRLGDVVCARKSTLAAWISEQEQKSARRAA